jgi:uncharacterized protein DUF5916/cellulose/xylan binding protein with CBM9 domain
MNRKAAFSYLFILMSTGFLFGQQAPYHPLRIKNSITLDGKLSESEWQQAEVESDFMQYDPTAGAEPSEKTELRMMYNDQYLYVGLRAFDHHPDQIVRYALQRDFETGNDDGFAFVIDMYNDKSTGLAFVTNTLNARWDTELFADGAAENDAYNTFWDVVSHIDSLGYTTEFRFPFSSLRFEPRDTVRMGFRVVRLIKRLNEFSIFPRCDPKIETAYFKLSLAREMEFYHLKSRKPFYIIPYGIMNYGEEKVLNADGTAYKKNSEFMVRKHFVKDETLDRILSNIGLDVKYGITKNFTLDATLNTDFAQAEADNVIVNLTKYDVNLPEKRNFFLESHNYLSYTTTTGNELFISRSIGIENDVIVPIIGGVRLTGKSHGWQMGLLDMQTKKIDDEQILAHNMFVFRTRKDIDKIGSFAGGIITNKLNTSGNDSSAQSFGLGVVKKLNSQTTIVGSVAGTTLNGNFKNIGEQMDYNAGYFHAAKESWYGSTDIDWVGKNFSPALGFIPENDLLWWRGDIGYRWKAPQESKKAYYYLHTNLRYKWKPHLGKEETKFANAEAGVSFKNGMAIDITPLEYLTDVVFQEWHLSEHITIPTGEYKMLTPDVEFTLPQKAKYWGTTFIKVLDFYGGNRITIQPNFTFVFNKHLSANLEYEYTHIKFPVEYSDNGSGLFSSNLVRLSASYYFSSKVSFKILSQYDPSNDAISSNLRFRYNPREGTDLYVVFNQGLNTDRSRMDPHLPVVDNQAVIVKFVKTFIL